MSGTALYGQQLYTKAQQGTPEFFRNFSEDINCVVQEFAKGRLGFYGIRSENFKLVPSVHYEFGSGETLTGYVLEGTFDFDHVRGDVIFEMRATVEPVEIDGPQQTGCDIQPCTKLYVRSAKSLHGHPTVYTDPKLQPNGHPVTDFREHQELLQAFCDLHERIADMCLSLTFELEDFYGDRLVEWSDVKRGF